MGGDAIGRALASSSSLITLSLWSNRLGDGACAGLAAGVAANKTLRTLNLDATELTGYGAETLCDGLKRNTSITVLTISRNDLRDRGALAFATLLYGTYFLEEDRRHAEAEALTSASAATVTSESPASPSTIDNRPLEQVPDSASTLVVTAVDSDKAIVALPLPPSFLRWDCRIRLLNLACCGITIVGATLLKDALRVNTVLQEIDFACNEVRDDVMAECGTRIRL